MGERHAVVAGIALKVPTSAHTSCTVRSIVRYAVFHIVSTHLEHTDENARLRQVAAIHEELQHGLVRMFGILSERDTQDVCK